MTIPTGPTNPPPEPTAHELLLAATSLAGLYGWRREPDSPGLDLRGALSFAWLYYRYDHGLSVQIPGRDHTMYGKIVAAAAEITVWTIYKQTVHELYKDGYLAARGIIAALYPAIDTLDLSDPAAFLHALSECDLKRKRRPSPNPQP